MPLSSAGAWSIWSGPVRTGRTPEWLGAEFEAERPALIPYRGPFDGRRFGRGQTSYDPWHYVPVRNRKPGALRNGAPFKGWVLPGLLGRVQRTLARVNDGDRQVVTILSAVLSDGLEAVEAACQEALADASRQGTPAGVGTLPESHQLTAKQ